MLQYYCYYFGGDLYDPLTREKPLEIRSLQSHHELAARHVSGRSGVAGRRWGGRPARAAPRRATGGRSATLPTPRVAAA